MAEACKTDLPTFFEIGENKTKNLFETLVARGLEFKDILLLGDPRTFLIGGNTIVQNFKRANITVIKHLVSNSDEQNVKRVKKVITEKKPDLVIGFGGGKVLDVAKLAAGRCKTKFISVPTTLSNDGISSPVSVIKDKHNIPVSHITKAPCGVVVDISVIKKAPIRHLRAGVGDLISNLSAVFDARLARSKGIEKINDTAFLLAEAGPVNLLELKDTFIRGSPFLLCLAHGLIKSGTAMCIVGSSRPASGSEHKLSHSIDHLYAPRKSLHGEQVGIATIFTMALQGNSYLPRVRRLYERISFSQNLRRLSLDPEKFIQVVINAKKFRLKRYTILEHKNLKPDEIRKIIKKIKL